MSYLDPLYINYLGTYLEGFKEKSRNLWEFRCPICLDSSKSKTKKRGYIFEKKGQFFFFCHNCSASFRFDTFLKKINPHLYGQYQFEKLSKTNFEPQNGPVSYVSEKPVFLRRETVNLPTVNDLEDGHICKEYVKSRKIPEDKWFLLYFAQDFGAFVEELIPGKYQFRSEPRLVLPFFDTSGKIIGGQGRALMKSKIRYETFRVGDDKMFFGLERINPKKLVKVVEGPIDSLFLTNCIAMCGSHNSDVPFENCVFVLDAEPRNKQIVSKMEGLINAGRKVFIWPDTYMSLGKDINDMVLKEVDTEELDEYIEKNAKTGLISKLELAKWRKC